MIILRAKNGGFEEIKARGLVHITGSWYGKIISKGSMAERMRCYVYYPSLHVLAERDIPLQNIHPSGDVIKRYLCALNDLDLQNKSGDALIPNMCLRQANGKWLTPLEREILRRWDEAQPQS